MLANTVLVIAVAALTNSADIKVGKEAGRIIYDEDLQASPAIWRQILNVTVNATENEVISGVFIKDKREEKDGSAKIVEGGVGQKSVTIELKSPTVLRGYEFEIKIYSDDPKNVDHPISVSLNPVNENEQTRLDQPKTNLNGPRVSEPSLNKDIAIPAQVSKDGINKDSRNTRDTEERNADNFGKSTAKFKDDSNAPFLGGVTTSGQITKTQDEKVSSQTATTQLPNIPRSLVNTKVNPNASATNEKDESRHQRDTTKDDKSAYGSFTTSIITTKDRYGKASLQTTSTERSSNPDSHFDEKVVPAVVASTENNETRYQRDTPKEDKDSSVKSVTISSQTTKIHDGRVGISTTTLPTFTNGDFGRKLAPAVVATTEMHETRHQRDTFNVDKSVTPTTSSHSTKIENERDGIPTSTTQNPTVPHSNLNLKVVPSTVATTEKDETRHQRETAKEDHTVKPAFGSDSTSHPTTKVQDVRFGLQTSTKSSIPHSLFDVEGVPSTVSNLEKNYTRHRRDTIQENKAKDNRTDSDDDVIANVPLNIAKFDATTNKNIPMYHQQESYNLTPKTVSLSPISDHTHSPSKPCCRYQNSNPIVGGTKKENITNEASKRIARENEKKDDFVNPHLLTYQTPKMKTNDAKTNTNTKSSNTDASTHRFGEKSSVTVTTEKMETVKDTTDVKTNEQTHRGLRYNPQFGIKSHMQEDKTIAKLG